MAESNRNKVSHFLNFFKNKESINTDTDLSNYKLSPHKRLYVIGDIHGCDHLLEPALEKIIVDSYHHPDKEIFLITLGDYVDRGPNSKNVIELLLSKIPSHIMPIFLQGNHEIYMRAFIALPQENTPWLEYGGIETLRSYDVIPPDKEDPDDLERAALELKSNMPDNHFCFLNNLYKYYIIDDYLFVHAGIDPDLPLIAQTDQILTTIRTKFINHKGTFNGKRIIHGHTPVERIDITPHRVNLDTGAYLTGTLTVAIFEGNMVKVL